MNDTSTWVCANCGREAGRLEQPYTVDNYIVCQRCQMFLLQQRAVDAKARRWLARLPWRWRVAAVVAMLVASVACYAAERAYDRHTARLAIYRECLTAYEKAKDLALSQFRDRANKLERGSTWTLSRDAVVFRVPDDLLYERTGKSPWILPAGTEILITSRDPVENGIWYSFVTKDFHHREGFITNRELSKQQDASLNDEAVDAVRDVIHWSTLETSLKDIADRNHLTLDQVMSLVKEGNSKHWQ